MAPVRIAASVVTARGADGAWNGVALTGAPGCGKSSVALRMIAHGAALVADDAALIAPPAEGAADRRPVASAPPALVGLIEARGVGILHMDARPSTPLAWIIELAPSDSLKSEARALREAGDLEALMRLRLPEPKGEVYFGLSVPKLTVRVTDATAAALICLARGVRLWKPR